MSASISLILLGMSATNQFRNLNVSFCNIKNRYSVLIVVKTLRLLTKITLIFSDEMPFTFLDVINQLEDNLRPNGNLDTQVAYMIKNKECYKDGNSGLKDLMDRSIIKRQLWSNRFFDCLPIVNGGDDKDTQEDQQSFRFLALVRILVETKSELELSSKQSSTIQEIKEGFHFVMRCFFNEEAYPRVSTSRLHPFDKFSSTFYQNSIRNVTEIMIHELVDSVEKDQHLYPYMERRYRKFKEKFSNNKCT